MVLQTRRHRQLPGQLDRQGRPISGPLLQTLNIGSRFGLVFLDDNPFERNFVREQLPMVAVPEVPDDDPALVPGVLADAGYFESLGHHRRKIIERTDAISGKPRALGAAGTSAGDHGCPISATLDMRHGVESLRQLSACSRVVQLINKTNQFNLTTRRHTDADIRRHHGGYRRASACRCRLLDRFGDNGIIGIVIGRTTAARHDHASTPG